MDKIVNLPEIVDIDARGASTPIWSIFPGKPFRNATNTYAPQAAILFDKFHVIRHLGEALDTVRKSLPR